MALDNDLGTFVLPTRPELIAKYERDYKLVRPSAKTGEGTQVNLQARLVVDQVLPIHARGASLARLASLEDMTLEQLRNEATKAGLPDLLPATGATGFVRASTSLTGGNILENDECADPNNTSLRFRCTEGRLYTNGEPVPVEGISTGTTTNLAPGFVLQWSSPRAGVGANCTVLEAGDGEGLTGGHAEEAREGLIDRISEARANPAAAGNDAEYQRVVRATPGVPVEAVWTFPAIVGPGQIAIVFTVRPSVLGGSRIPNLIQEGKAMEAVRASKLPLDDTVIFSDLIEMPIDMVLEVDWASGSTGWQDAAPFPAYAAAPNDWHVTDVTDAMTFTIDGATGTPSVGNRIAFYDQVTKTFVRKTLLTVTPAGGEFDVTCDPANQASDTTYVPVVTERFCPWSDSLALLLPVVLAEFGKLGPSEQVAVLFDAEARQRRSPPSPDVWPSKLTGRILVPLYGLTSTVDVLEPSLPFQTPEGLPADSCNLLTLNSLYVFPAA